MSKNVWKKCAASTAGATFTCLVTLLIAARHRAIPVDNLSKEGDALGTRSLQSVDNNRASAELSPHSVQTLEKTLETDIQSFSAYLNKLTRGKREVERPSSARKSPPVEDISPGDIFLAVKTTNKFHQSRLDLLLETWISRNMQQTFIFTDGQDKTLQMKLGSHVVNTNCSSAHSRQALSCKMAVEYDTFLQSDKKWFCHVDDDNYVIVPNLVALLGQHHHTQDVYIGRPSLDRPIEATERLADSQAKPVRFWFATGGAGFCVSRGLALKMSPWASGGHFISTAERIRLPDDCTMGYIIESLLGVRLIRSGLFHSHLENLQQVASSELHKQVTLSYGMFENQRNILNIRGTFSLDQDPSRFRSVHCLLYPETPWCPSPILK